MLQLLPSKESDQETVELLVDDSKLIDIHDMIAEFAKIIEPHSDTIASKQLEPEFEQLLCS